LLDDSSARTLEESTEALNYYLIVFDHLHIMEKLKIEVTHIAL